MSDGPSSPLPPPERSVDVSTQLQNLRNLLNSDRQSVVDHQRRLETIEQEMSLRTGLLERQRRDLDNPQNQALAAHAESLPTSNSPSSLVRSRRRAFRPSERLQRNRERYSLSVRGDPSTDPNGLRRVNTPPAFTEGVVDEHGTEAQTSREQQFRSKRRKLDDGTFDDETRIISYGDEGRVTPGPLKMDIIRCDGGDYHDSTTSSAQLVLQDDNNVYSTKENKCNMLMKHIGGMPFSLTQIVIKAPSDGFDSPIQEGMVFVAMSDEKLLEKTAHHEKYSPRSYKLHHPYRRSDHYRPSQEYLNSSRSPLRTIDRSRYLQDPQPPWSRYAENDSELEASLIPGFDVSYVDPSESEVPPSRTSRSPVPWRDVDAEYSLRSYADRYRPNNDNQDRESMTSSESEDDYIPPFRENGNADDLDEQFAHHRRILDRMRITSEGGRDDHDWHNLHPSRRAQHEERNNGAPIRRWAHGGDPFRRYMLSREDIRSNGTNRDETNSSAATSYKPMANTSTRTPLPASDQLPPHARFSMTASQTSIAINFDPPVAGRYILIKLWASCPASNIDVQCILPHGYGGPRFFPSIEIR